MVQPVGAGPLYRYTGVGAGNVVPAIAPHTHEDQTFGVVGRWAHEDQTLPSGQLGSVNSISVGLSQRSSHLRSHPKYLIQNQLESLLCLPGPGSFPIYIPSLSCWCCTRQRAMCNVRCGSCNTLYPRRSSWEIYISPSRVVTDVKNQNSCSAELGSSRLRQHRCSTELETRFNHAVGVPLRVWL